MVSTCFPRNRLPCVTPSEAPPGTMDEGTIVPMQSIPLLAGALAIMTACASDDTVPAKPAAAEKDARWLVYEGDAEKAPGHGRRIVMVSGDEEYRSEEGLPMLGRMLAHHGFEAGVLFSQAPETGEIDPENLEHIPGLHLGADADVLVLQLPFRELPDADMKHIVDHVEAGKPLVGLRTSTHAFFYRKRPESMYGHWSWNSSCPVQLKPLSPCTRAWSFPGFPGWPGKCLVFTRLYR